MEEVDRKRFMVLMYWLAEKFPLAHAPRKLSLAEVTDYFTALADIRIERLEWGSREWYAKEIFFPKPPELRRVANLAPSSVLPPVPKPLQLEDRTPPELVAERVASILAQMKAKFGESRNPSAAWK